MPSLLTSLATPALQVLNYNRANFLHDRGQEVGRAYTGITYRIAQFGQYRQDVRDIAGMTTLRMNNFHVVTCLELTMCVGLLGPARMPADVPEWVVWHQLLSLCSAFAYLVAALWLSTFAAVSAESFCVRLQTQYIRLPVADDLELDQALTKADDFEEAQPAAMARVPFFQRVADTILGGDMYTAASSGADSKVPASHRSADGGPSFAAAPLAEGYDTAAVAAATEDYGYDPALDTGAPLVSLEHLQLYRQLQRNWQGLDAYARVCMTVGTHWLLVSLAHYMVGWTLCHHQKIAPAVAGTTICVGAGCMLTYLDLVIGRVELVCVTLLVAAGPALVCGGAALQEYNAADTPLVSACAGMVHAALVAYFWLVGRSSSREAALPLRFRGVRYLDLFGPIIKELEESEEQDDYGYGVSSSPGVGVPGRFAQEMQRPAATAKQPSLYGRPCAETEEASRRLAIALADCAKASLSLAKKMRLLQVAINYVEASFLEDDVPLTDTARRTLAALQMAEEARSLRQGVAVAQAQSRGAEFKLLGRVQAELDGTLSRLGNKIGVALDKDPYGPQGVAPTAGLAAAAPLGDLAARAESLSVRSHRLLANWSTAVPPTTPGTASMTLGRSPREPKTPSARAPKVADPEEIGGKVKHASQNEQYEAAHAEDSRLPTNPASIRLPTRTYHFLSCAFTAMWLAGVVAHLAFHHAGISHQTNLSAGRRLVAPMFGFASVAGPLAPAATLLPMEWPLPESFYGPTTFLVDNNTSDHSTGGQPPRLLVSNGLTAYGLSAGRNGSAGEAVALACQPLEGVPDVVAVAVAERSQGAMLLAGRQGLARCGNASQARDQADAAADMAFLAPPRGRPILLLRPQQQHRRLIPVGELAMPRYAPVRGSSWSWRGLALLRPPPPRLRADGESPAAGDVLVAVSASLKKRGRLHRQRRLRSTRGTGARTSSTLRLRVHAWNALDGSYLGDWALPQVLETEEEGGVPARRRLRSLAFGACPDSRSLCAMTLQQATASVLAGEQERPPPPPAQQALRLVKVFSTEALADAAL
eukprot:TRINITY_DN81486_c0_g1_i1.p1 TRINITY_DN81486_c0_g1~~TRINITY_DN81486_c0_g1_i1.p1  ORF type:complete len:1045 (-),score=210.37 TRINITY_DN81486_c0_g1_i1:125-3259(-)